MNAPTHKLNSQWVSDLGTSNEKSKYCSKFELGKNIPHTMTHPQIEQPAESMKNFDLVIFFNFIKKKWKLLIWLYNFLKIMYNSIPWETRFPQTKLLIPPPISLATVDGFRAIAVCHCSKRLLTNKCRDIIIASAEAKTKIQAYIIEQICQLQWTLKLFLATLMSFSLVKIMVSVMLWDLSPFEGKEQYSNMTPRTN